MGKAATKILIIILVVTLFVSFFGSIATLNRFGGFKSLTGAWDSGTTTYGSTNITITSQTLINFTTQNITFGSGYVTSGSSACIMDSEGTASVGCTGFVSSLKANLTLENMGNNNVKLNLSNVNNSQSFIGGTEPGYALMWDELEDDLTTCTNGTSGVQAVTQFGPEAIWKNITASMLNASSSWCMVFNATDTADTLAIGFRLLVPTNAPPRMLEDIFTASAVAI